MKSEAHKMKISPDAKKAAKEREVQKWYRRYVKKHSGANLDKLETLVTHGLAADLSREEIVALAVKDGYLAEYTRGLLSDALGEASAAETSMEVVSLAASVERMHGERAAEILRDAYFICEAMQAAERLLRKKRGRLPSPSRRKPSGGE
jgi:hypothetical protein